MMFLVPWFIPAVVTEPKQFLLEEASDGNSSAIQTKDTTKKDSWITYDSGIDLTVKENNSHSCTLDQASNSTARSQRKATRERKLSNLIDRYIRGQRRTLVPGSITNSFAMSRLDLNSDQVVIVEKVTIV